MMLRKKQEEILQLWKIPNKKRYDNKYDNNPYKKL